MTRLHCTSKDNNVVAKDNNTDDHAKDNNSDDHVATYKGWPNLCMLSLS